MLIGRAVTGLDVRQADLGADIPIVYPEDGSATLERVAVRVSEYRKRDGYFPLFPDRMLNPC